MKPLRKSSAGLAPVSEGFDRKGRFWKRPAIPLVLAMIAGILWGKFLPLPFWPLFCLILVSLGSLFLSLRKPFFLSASVLPLVGFCFLGHLLGLSLHNTEKKALRLHEFCKEERVLVTGRIHGIPAPRSSRTQCKLSDVVLTLPSGDFLAVEGLLLFTLLDGPEEPLLPGSLVRIHGRVKPFYNFENPGAFDYKAFQYAKRILGRISCRAKDFEVLESGSGSFSAKVDRFRMAFSDHVRERVQDENAAAVLCTMLIGDKRFLPPEIREAYGKTGAGHLLAISGLHVGLLAGGLFFLLERFFRLFPPLILRGWTRKAAVCPAIFFAISYSLVSGGAPSALRAVTMTVCLFALLFLRKSTDPWSLLALAAGFLLAVRPEMITDTGFLMSFAAVCGLILGFSRYPIRNLEKVWMLARFGRWGEGLVKTSFFAFLFTAPIGLFVFRQIPLIGIGANLVMVPIMAMLVLPLAMAGLFINVFPGGGGNLFLAWSGKLAHWGNFCALRLAEVPFACLQHVTLTLVECFLVYAFLVLWLGWKKKKAAGIRLFLVFVLFGCTGLDWFSWKERRNGPSSPLVLQMDVGQGASAVIRLPGGSVFLVDGGGFPWLDAMDTGERILSPWLDMQRIRTLDALILSHPHSDHARGFFHLAENYRIKELWISKEACKEPMGMALAELLESRGTRIRHPSPEEPPIEIRNVRFRFIGPEEGGPRSTNNVSLVFRMETNSGTMLFTGDIEREAEAFYLDGKRPFLRADVLQIPHHGSRNSSSKDFLEAVAPSCALISCGQDNIYRYPAPQVLQRLGENKVKVFRTDQGGAVTVQFGEEGLEIAQHSTGFRDRLW